MELATKDYIISTVFKTNILPIISECNTSCIFCSHKQNPEGVEIFRMPKLGIIDFAEIVEFLSSQKKIVIGEAATRIVEGEPFIHKDIIEILFMVRSRFPKTPIQITTNGILLTENVIETLENLGGIELNVSVNCINPVKRREILGLKNDSDITGIIKELKGRIKFSGSCVFVAEIMDYSDLEQMAELLDDCGAEMFRIFIQGHTDKLGKNDEFLKTYKELSAMQENLRKKYTIPMILEPSVISELTARVEGVIANSPADKAGLRNGDVISEIDGIVPLSRVEAFDKVFYAANPLLRIQRGCETLDIGLKKPRNTPPGFIMLYDIKAELADEVNEVIKRHSAQNTMIITSELGYEAVRNLLGKRLQDADFHVLMAKSRYFGGNIKCAGLLLAEDVIAAAEEYIKENTKPDLIILPSIMFDFKKRDLTGKSISEIEDKLKITVDSL